ncbi:MAG: HD domain-containing protein [Burkholderiales bacterium]
MEENLLFRYWGKASPEYPGEPKWHPVVYHSLDMAVVRRELTCLIDFWIEHAAFF